MSLRVGRCAVTVLIMHAWAAPDRGATAEEVFQNISRALITSDDDEETTRVIENAQPSERIDADAVRVLKEQWAGPRTMRALENLQARSANLPAPADAVVTTAGGADEARQKAILAKITEYASHYVSALPNMSCTESTRFTSSGHESGLRGTRKPSAKLTDGWRLEDTVVEDLDYYQGTETYHTRSLNGAPEARPMGQIRLSYSRGELGSVLADTFDPASETQFVWDHWENLQGRRVAVFRFAIDRDHTHYWVCCVSTGSMTVNGIVRRRYKKWMSAYRGFVYADPDTGSILRFVFRNIEIPAEYNLQDARNLIEYSTVTLSGRTFLVPVRGVHFSRTQKGQVRDEIEFTNYRVFGADSSISFPKDEK
ncbi:MAG TPA: hypothetical protein VMJ34_19935 [Bryobacteraceae bacterium]|nr:hypothetical protein [Bryobacteraceae bacterium]